VRYFKPGTDTKQSLFTPLPLDFMAEKVTTEQTGFDTAQSTLAAAADALYAKHLTSQENAYQELIAKHYKGVDNILTTLNSEGNWRSVAPMVTSATREWTNDPTKKVLESNYDNYLLYQKSAQDHLEKGTYGEWNDKFKDWTPYLADGVTPNTFDFTGIQKAEDYVTKASELMKGMKESGL